MDRDAGAGPAAEEDERERLAAEEAGELPACEVNKAFFSLIAEVQRTLRALENAVGPTTEESRGAHNDLDEPRSLAAIFEDVYAFDEVKKRREIEERTTEIQTLIKQAKLKLQDIKADAEDEKKNYSVADKKMRTNMYTTLVKRTDDLSQRFLELKQKYRKHNEATMLRQVKHTAPVDKETGKEYTGDELELMAAQCLETGTSPYMTGLAHSTLEDVLRKHKEIVQLERAVEEVAQMFADLAILVAVQGEQLDNIEAHVTMAHAETKKGVKELQKANEYARKNRKRMCCLWWCLVAVLVAILFPLLASAIFGL